jgi:hypothetical protein
MKIISFNTFLAPSMPSRFNRKMLIVKKVISWMDDNVDVISLQELNDFALGIFGFLFYKYCFYLYFGEFLQRFFDIIFIIEGYIFPFYNYDNTKEFFDAVDFYNLSNENKYYIIKSKISKRGINGGLVIISKFPIKGHISVNLPSDNIHAPSLLCTILDDKKNNKDILYINSHLIPKLNNYTYMYTFVNFVNYICRHNIESLQKLNIDLLKTTIKCFINNNIDIYATGDFNIKKKITPDMYEYLINSIKLIDATNSRESCYICTQHHIKYKDGEKNHEEDQIDYIFSTKNPKIFNRIETCIDLSDHYPIIAEY